jgi:hypothetical protein
MIIEMDTLQNQNLKLSINGRLLYPAAEKYYIGAAGLRAGG